MYEDEIDGVLKDVENLDGVLDEDDEEVSSSIVTEESIDGVMLRQQQPDPA